jgi:glycine cleavage system pyridoxal-binding protein P
LQKLFDEEMEGDDENSLGNASLLMTGGSMAEARQTIKRSKTGMRQSIMISDQGKNLLSKSLNAYANEIESPYEELSGYDSEDSQPAKR